MIDHQTNPTAPPVANDWGSRSHVQTLVLMILGPVALTVTTVLLEIWRNRAVDPPTVETHSKTRPPRVEGRSA